jgi:multiple sugar transport system substrate-binding protein
MKTYLRRGRTTAAALLVPGLVLTALSACGDGDDVDLNDPNRNADATELTITITANAIAGGKNAELAEWLQDWAIPEFEAQMAADGVEVTVEFAENGADDEDYKTQIALDLSTGGGADLIDGFDGIWVGEFAQAQYIRPLEEIAGDAIAEWDGWAQIPEAVQQNMSFEDQLYGVPGGTDGRVLYFNKELFAQAGLPEDWQPTSWEEILEAGRALKEIDGVTPIQINAGTAMGEATTMQGVLPLLVGAGVRIWDGGTWQGASAAVTQVLELYETIYATEELGDPLLQQEAAGRDNSFLQFSEGEIGILLEGDYFWRSVINPDGGIAPMENRDEVVGWAMIPAVQPGGGVDGQDFVSMSGGGGFILNPNTRYPQQAWQFLEFINSVDAQLNRHADEPKITSREDVNSQLINDPMISFIAEEVLPITFYRPGLEVYPQVSVALQEATGAVASGTPAAEAAASYQSALEGIVGDDADIAS